MSNLIWTNTVSSGWCIWTATQEYQSWTLLSPLIPLTDLKHHSGFYPLDFFSELLVEKFSRHRISKIHPHHLEEDRSSVLLPPDCLYGLQLDCSIWRQIFISRESVIGIVHSSTGSVSPTDGCRRTRLTFFGKSKSQKVHFNVHLLTWKWNAVLKNVYS